MPSALMQWYQGLKSGPDPATPSRSITTLKALGHGTAGAVEATLIGAGLGALSANMKSGLDFKLGGTKIPIDAAAGLAFTLASTKAADSPWGAYLRTAADSSWAIFGFRHFETKAAAMAGTGAAVVANKAAAIKAAGEDDERDGAVGVEDSVIEWGRTAFATGE